MDPEKPRLHLIPQSRCIGCTSQGIVLVGAICMSCLGSVAPEHPALHGQQLGSLFAGREQRLRLFWGCSWDATHEWYQRLQLTVQPNQWLRDYLSKHVHGFFLTFITNCKFWWNWMSTTNLKWNCRFGWYIWYGGISVWELWGASNSKFCEQRQNDAENKAINIRAPLIILGMVAIQITSPDWRAFGALNSPVRFCSLIQE